MKKPSAKNSRREPTTAANLEARFEAYARRQKLPHFSAALEAASHLV